MARQTDGREREREEEGEDEKRQANKVATAAAYLMPLLPPPLLYVCVSHVANSLWNHVCGRGGGGAAAHVDLG